ncbi:MAG: hypothetical protein ACK4NY_23905 [Spirosomataceae bacterium]
MSLPSNTIATTSPASQQLSSPGQPNPSGRGFGSSTTAPVQTRAATTSMRTSRPAAIAPTTVAK